VTFPHLKISVIEMGLDKQTADISEYPVVKNKNAEINLLYAGIFYKKLREPFNLYSAILSGPENINLIIFGKCSYQYLPTNNKKITYGGLILKNNLKEKYNKADVIVFIDNFYGIQMPAKILEVIALNKPILFIYENDNSPSLNYSREHDGIYYAKNTVDSIRGVLFELTKIKNYVYKRNLTKYYWDNLLKEFDKII
jgi:hypothetical protein